MKGSVVCDLDGVVYLGNDPIAGVERALGELEDAGWHVLFATNNSARPPGEVVDKIHRVSGYRPAEAQIITSALVAASLVEEGPVMVMGEHGITEAVEAAGFEVTDTAADAATVIAGLDRGLSYDRVARAAAAVRSGARFIATNQDSTFPTPTGLLPGAGACIAAVEVASGVVGTYAGKPSDAMRRMIEERCPDGDIWMIGDRPDTDIALAAWPRWRSILVLTGVTADPDQANPAPDVVAADLPAAVSHILNL